jgi:phage shock protein PspC (stress-responsive transcriptional regulator)
MKHTQLRRNMAERRFAGVASGLSDFLGMDVWVIRLLFILTTAFSGGAGLVIYVLLWLIVPEDSSTSASALKPQRGPSWVLVVIALLIGLGILRDGHFLSTLVPIIAVAVVVFLVMKARKSSSWKARKEFDKARLAWQRRLDDQSVQSTTTNLGGNPFQIGSFYSQRPSTPGDGPETQTGFQIQ